jgi:omega-amidase
MTLDFLKFIALLASNVINIINLPARRVDHWNALLKGRAIENQLYIICINRTCTDGKGLEYVKSSQVFNANGELLNPESTEYELDIFDHDPEYIDRFKQTFSTTLDRKPVLYKSIL